MTNPLHRILGSDTPPESPAVALPGFEKVRRYWDRDNHRFAAKILPGEYYVTTHDEVIVTTLGSCISACVRDRIYGVGGMNHFMLPAQMLESDSWRNSRISLANRYGNHAMENLINDILKNGGERHNLEIKIFGGGRILAQMTDIGKRNITFIENYVATENLSLLAMDVGSSYPRKVVYHPASGRAKVKKLRALQNNTIIERETRYLQDIQQRPLEGDIELF
ncbi:MAG TPA: chemoreceptor glutamine deamidase CheD [Gammaproteobacteria bacterium]